MSGQFYKTLIPGESIPFMYAFGDSDDFAGYHSKAGQGSLVLPAAGAGTMMAVESVDPLREREISILRLHKALTITTAGVLLAAEAVGAYHFYDMMTGGHSYRDQIGFQEGDPVGPQIQGIQDQWGDSSSQFQRTLHGSLIVASSVLYSATAAMEFALPRMDIDPSSLSRPNLHRAAFYVHGALMVANVVLGFAESYALSQGNHEAVIGLGITHIAIGLAVPVLMIGSGLTFSVR
jgi:hypothetical protein